MSRIEVLRLELRTETTEDTEAETVSTSYRETSAEQLARMDSKTEQREWAEYQRTQSTHGVTDEMQEQVRKLRKKPICSCGHYTCPLLPRYGHPVPVYKEEIRPLPNQMKRDKRALELKGMDS